MNKATTARPAVDPEIRRQVLSGFRGTVPPWKPSLGYRLTLAGAAVVMLLMPLIYAAVVGGLGWLIFQYLMLLDFKFLTQGLGLVMLPALLLPAGLGVFVVIRLLKPLFGGGGGETRLRLDRAREPLVFEFVGRLCKALGAPVPKEIHVDCEVNASASFRRGLLSLFDTDDVVLVIGLPLVESLTLQQLAGIIAHETGHFSQKAGLRLSLVIRVMSRWLQLLVYRRDPFEETIRANAEQTGVFTVKAILYSVVAVIWLSRRILWTTMLAGYAVSAYVSRHLEYDADRYLVRLAGFDALTTSMREMFALNAAHDMSLEELQSQWEEKRLADSLPRLVLANRQSKAGEIAAALETHFADEKEEVFSSHPPVRKRIARAELEKSAGVFSSDLPAGALFADLPSIEKAASLQFYASRLGRQIRFADLVPVQAMRDLKQQSEVERAAFASYFQNPPLRAMRIPDRIPACEDREEGIRRLEEARRVVAEGAADHGRAKAEFVAASKDRSHALRASALLRAGYAIQAVTFKLPAGDLATAQRAAKRAQARMEEIAVVLARYEKDEAGRLEAALALFQHPAVAAELPGVAMAPEEMARLLGCGALLAERFPQLFPLQEDWNALDILVRQLETDGEPPPELSTEIQRMLLEVRGHLKVVHRALRDHPYPFEHGVKGTTLVQYIVPALPMEGDLAGHRGMIGTALLNAEEVQARLLSRLAWIASKVEEALGMPPLTPQEAPQEAPPEAPETAATPMPVHLAEPPLEPSVPRAVVAVKIAESKADAVEGRELFQRYFRNPLEWRAVPLPDRPPEPSGDPQAAVEVLWGALIALKKDADENGRRLLQYRGAEKRWTRAVQAEELLNAGFRIKPEDFGLFAADLRNAAHQRDRSLAQMEALEPALAAAEETQRQRLLQSLILLAEPQVADKVAGADSRGESATLLASLAGLQRSFPALRELRRNHLGLGVLMAQGPGVRARKPVADRLAPRVHEANALLRRLQRDLQAEVYPFEHPGEAWGTLAQKVVPSPPAAGDFESTHAAASLALRESADLHRRLLGRLAGVAERVELALGLG
ncbi:MAG: M48 family metalloprotease [Acidobacteriota bacterium]